MLAGALTLVAPVLVPSASAAAKTQSVADLLDDLEDMAAEKADPVLKSVAGEWSEKIVELGKSVKGNPEVQGYVSSAVKSVLGDNGPAAMEALQKLGSVEVTPEQLSLAKEVMNLGGAFLTQENFAGLEGSESDVAKVVNALRKGDYTAAVPPLKNIAGSVKLTKQQKDLVSAMLETYVPGAGAAKDLMKKIPGF